MKRHHYNFQESIKEIREIEESEQAVIPVENKHEEIAPIEVSPNEFH